MVRIYVWYPIKKYVQVLSPWWLEAVLIFSYSHFYESVDLRDNNTHLYHLSLDLRKCIHNLSQSCFRSCYRKH